MPLIAAEADCNIPPCNPFLILWFYRKSFYTKLSWLVAKLGKKMQKPHPNSSCHTPPLLLFSFRFNPKCKHPSARGRMNPVRTFRSPCLGPTGEQSEGICGYLYLWWVLDAPPPLPPIPAVSPRCFTGLLLCFGAVVVLCPDPCCVGSGWGRNPAAVWVWAVRRRCPLPPYAAPLWVSSPLGLPATFWSVHCALSFGNTHFVEMG